MEEKYMKNKINNKRKTKILTFSSFQNSSAKTTLVQNIGFELANQGYKILIVDADFSCRLSNFFDCDLTSEKNIFNAYKNSEWNEPVDIKKYISNTKYENLDIVHSTYEMININREFQGKSHKEDTFINIFENLVDESIYDLIIFDCNNNFTSLNYSILCTSNFVIIPLVTNPIEIMGLETILKDIGGIKKTNTKLKLLGFLKSKVSDNNSSGEAVKKMDKISEEYNVPFFESHIPYDENIFKSQLERMPLEVYANKYDINSNTVKEFKNLAEEIILRINKEKL
jgi:chromosome partitioning protein